MPKLYVERILVVAGDRNAGKSTQLRAMFLDPRLGEDGVIPTRTRLDETYEFSPNRRLYLRLTSPHERDESPSQFVRKIRNRAFEGRWCIALASQLTATRKMPDLVGTVRVLRRAFSPECIRVAILDPMYGGAKNGIPLRIVDRLWSIRRCEVLRVDARGETQNGLLLADTFDFC